jgi:hypothetical protein
MSHNMEFIYIYISHDVFAISHTMKVSTPFYKTTLMCVNAVESKYQLLNKCKLYFNLVVHQQ